MPRYRDAPHCGPRLPVRTHPILIAVPKQSAVQRAGQLVYFFGVLLPQDITNSPTGWVNYAGGSPTNTSWNPAVLGGGGPNLTFDNLWRSPGGAMGISFGNTLSGFDVQVNTLTAPTSVQWFAYSADFAGGSPYLGGGEFVYGPLSLCISNGFASCLQEEEENPGFTGTASTPEPSSLLLLATGLLALGPFVRRFAHS